MPWQMVEQVYVRCMGKKIWNKISVVPKYSMFKRRLVFSLCTQNVRRQFQKKWWVVILHLYIFYQTSPGLRDRLNRERETSVLYTACRFGHLDLVTYLVEVWAGGGVGGCVGARPGVGGMRFIWGYILFTCGVDSLFGIVWCGGEIDKCAAMHMFLWLGRCFFSPPGCRVRR